MAGYGDLAGGLPPDLFDLGPPDPSSLQWPWDVSPAPAATPVTGTPELQPGIGIPAAALDAAIPPAPELGPPTADQAAAAAGTAPPPDLLPQPPAPVPPGPPPLPFGAGAAQPELPPIGPPPATVAQLPGITITQEPPAPPVFDAQHLPDEQTLANLPAEQYLKLRTDFEARQEQQLADERERAAAENQRRAQENADAMRKAFVVAQQRADEVDRDARALANERIDPERWWADRSTGQKIAGFAAAIVGGLVAARTGGPNVGLQAIQQSIDADIDAQKANLANRRGLLGQRQSAVAEMFARTGDIFRATEGARIASWEATIQHLQAEAQKVDPAGTTAFRYADLIRAGRAQQAASQEAIRREDLKTTFEAYKIAQRDRELAETERKNRAEEAAKAAKLAGAGVAGGGATNPNYTVPTGFFNPFTGDPVLGKRQIGGKGEDPKERNAVSAQIGTYGHVQDYWAKLAAIGDKIGYAKSLGESAWKARRGTLESEYDAAKEALTVYLTKELGDKLTQGQLEAQAHRIPDRASVFEARDPGQQIAAAQSDADRDFARDMTQVGIDPDPIIRAAQQRRVQVQPTPEADSNAAHAALAANPADKDAQRAAEAADQRLQAEVAKEQERKAAIDTVQALPATIEPLPVDEGRPAAEVARVKAANTAAQHYGALYSQFAKAAGDTSFRKGLKPGELAAAERANDRKLGDLALGVIAAQKQAEEQRIAARGEISRNATVEHAKRLGIDPDEALNRIKVGLPIDGSLPVPPPPPEPAIAIPPDLIFPNRSFLPGADPSLPRFDINPSAPLAPKKRKGKY